MARYGMVNARRRRLLQQVGLRLALGAEHCRYRLQQMHVIRVGVLLRQHLRELNSHLARWGRAVVTASSRYNVSSGLVWCDVVRVTG